MSRPEVYELVKPQLIGDGTEEGLITRSGGNGLPGRTHYLFSNERGEENVGE